MGYNSSHHTLTYTLVAVGYAKSHFHVSVRSWECVHMDCYHWQPEEHIYWSCAAWEPKFSKGTGHRKNVWWYKSNFPVLITTLFLFLWYYTGLQQLPNFKHWLYPHLQKKTHKPSEFFWPGTANWNSSMISVYFVRIYNLQSKAQSEFAMQCKYTKNQVETGIFPQPRILLDWICWCASSCRGWQARGLQKSM